MTLQRRLVAVMALTMVIGLLIADVVVYASVRSFLYGRADATLAQDETLAFNYLTFASGRNLPVSEASLSRRVSTDVYVIVLNPAGHVVLRRPSGSPNHPDPSPVLTNDIPVQQVPDMAHAGRYAGTFRPDPEAVVLGSHGDPLGQYRTVAVTVPQGTLITSLSLNPTTDTLTSLRTIELLASLAVILAMAAITTVVVRRGLRPLRQMAGTAAAIASGDLTSRVPEERLRAHDEVGRLGMALNQMLEQIEGAFAEKSASEERLRQFAADASHELRTPLTSIRGYAELLGRGGFADDASRRKALKRIEEEATRMGGLVEDLLLLAELDRGRPLRAEPVDLHRICADAVGDSVALASSHRLRLESGWPGDRGGRRRAAGPGGPQPGAQRAGPHAAGERGRGVDGGVRAAWGSFRCRTTGPALRPKRHLRVFDRFYQGDPSRSGAGTGLGLAIVHAIATASGGTAEVRKTPAGTGSGRPWWSRSRWRPRTWRRRLSRRRRQAWGRGRGRGRGAAGRGRAGGGAAWACRPGLRPRREQRRRRRTRRPSAQRNFIDVPGSTASSTVDSLTLVSAASAAGSESATMPAPARSITAQPLASSWALRIPIIHSPSPDAPAQPTGPAQYPRSPASAWPMKARASGRGVPPTAGVGCRRSRSSRTPTPTPSWSWPSMRVPRWATERKATREGASGTASWSQYGARVAATASTT